MRGALFAFSFAVLMLFHICWWTQQSSYVRQEEDKVSIVVGFSLLSTSSMGVCVVHSVLAAGIELECHVS